jgi:hypothetical protein
VLLVAVIANHPRVSRRAISQPPGAESQLFEFAKAGLC